MDIENTVGGVAIESTQLLGPDDPAFKHHPLCEGETHVDCPTEGWSCCRVVISEIPSGKPVSVMCFGCRKIHDVYSPNAVLSGNGKQERNQ
jgi:hypothetical protein